MKVKQADVPIGLEEKPDVSRASPPDLSRGVRCNYQPIPSETLGA